MSKTRLDVLLTERGLFESREKAKAAIMAGVVFVNGQRSDKAGMTFDPECDIEVRGGTNEFVSRGGYKLKKALAEFGVDPSDKICIDCGASTGGFTDCLLKNGAAKVYSIDVGYGQLAWSLRNDPRVVSMERTNIRYVTEEQIPDKASLSVIDVSFISLKLVLPVIRRLLSDDGEVVCLIKPQFEAGKDKVGKKGVVRERETHLEVLDNFVHYSRESGFFVENLTFSPIKGPEGNIEYLGHLVSSDPGKEIDTAAVVELSHRELDGR
ncbi:MAG: TlyA family RNA methyltransferase [Oscillospiraceae bacterium]|nr:TlyA family RNA methyltransferase [Oscillospiraceae bacterium]